MFENYFDNFQKKFRKISRIIMENLEKYFIKVFKIFRKISKIITKSFGRFREILWKFMRSISDKNLEKILKNDLITR